jgi:2,4-diaminopentanoate dehydrogenase
VLGFLKEKRMKKMEIVQVGLGPIGQKITEYAVTKENIKIAGAVDPAPDKKGKKLGDVCKIEKNTDIIVSADIETCLKGTSPVLAVISTFSSLKDILPQVRAIASRGINIVSTCEEMAFPLKIQPELAEEINALAKDNGISVLGTGVNPGFVMDYFPVSLTAVCQKVDRIQVWRIQDASLRRVPFQKKIGVGLTADEFKKKAAGNTIRHVGLSESMHMIASGMNWIIDKTEDIINPVIAQKEILAGYIPVSKGNNAGVEQIGKGYMNGKEIITLVFRASVGEENPADKVRIEGIPEINATLPGGINGDIATCAITVNAIPRVIDASPGLKSMLEIPVVSCFM